MKKRFLRNRSRLPCGKRSAGGGDLSQDGEHGADVLSVEEVRWFGRFRAEATETVGGGEPEVEAVGGGFEPDQEDASGRAVKKALRPAGKRKVVGFLRMAYDVNERRACRAYTVSEFESPVSIH